MGEREIQGRKRERYRGDRGRDKERESEIQGRDTGEKERGGRKKKINYKHKKIHGILSCASLRRTE